MGNKKKNIIKKLSIFSILLVLIYDLITLVDPLVYANTYYTEGSTRIIFEESFGQTKSRTINIPNLYKVNDIKVDNGTVSYSINGDNLTVTARNGNWINRESYWDDYKFSRYQTAYRTSTVNSFSSTYYYNSGGYSGTLYTSGSSYVSSGSYVSADSRRQETTRTGSAVTRYECRQVGSYYAWQIYDQSVTNQPNSIYYNSGGYSGTLNRYNTVQTGDTGAITMACNQWSVGSRGTRTQTYLAYYSGTVVRPESDTRVYRQNYAGYVYQGGTSYRNETYAYVVDIDYMRNLPPEIKLDTGLSNQRITKVNGYDSFSVSGYIYDPDNDDVEVTAKIGDITKKTIVKSTMSSSRFEIDFSLDELGLENGVYTVEVTAFDGKNGRDTSSFDITIRDAVFDGSYILVDDWVQFLTTITDYENDSIIKEQFKYVHDPNYFENSSRTESDEGATRKSPYEQTTFGLISDHDSWIDAAYDSFTTVGHYKVFARAKDQPKNHPAFEEFEKWSNEISLDFYVHRKPVSHFDAYMNMTGEVLIKDNSYDLDSYSKGEKGIEIKDWSYRQIGTTNWSAAKPSQLNPSLSYELRLIVTDFQGATDEYIGPIQLVEEFPNEPPVAGFTHHEAPYYIGDYVKLVSSAKDIDNDPIDIWYEIIKDGVTVVQIDKQSVSSPYQYDTYFRVNEPGEYIITQYVTDNIDPVIVTHKETITVNEMALVGKVLHTDQWTKIHEERGCSEPCSQFYSGERIVLETDVLDFPIVNNEVTVNVQGTQRTHNGTQPVSFGHGTNANDSEAASILLEEDSATGIYKNFLYREWMIEPKTQFEVGSYVDFVFTTIYQKETEVNGETFINEQVLTDEERIEIIGNAYEAFPFHQSY